MKRAHGSAGDAQLPRRDLKLKDRCVPSPIAGRPVEGDDEGVQISPGTLLPHGEHGGGNAEK